jgi:hypothetical protein
VWRAEFSGVAAVPKYGQKHVVRPGQSSWRIDRIDEDKAVLGVDGERRNLLPPFLGNAVQRLKPGTTSATRVISAAAPARRGSTTACLQSATRFGPGR